MGFKQDIEKLSVWVEALPWWPVKDGLEVMSS